MVILAAICGGFVVLFLAACWFWARRDLTQAEAKALAEQEMAQIARDLSSDDESVRKAAIDRYFYDQFVINSLLRGNARHFWPYAKKLREELIARNADLKRELHDKGRTGKFQVVDATQEFKDLGLPKGTWAFAGLMEPGERIDILVVGRRLALFRDFRAIWGFCRPGQEPDAEVLQYCINQWEQLRPR